MTTRAGPVSSGHTLVIEPSRPFRGLGVKELWQYRGLCFFLVWRDVRVRYAQTVLGAGWAILQPLLTMVVFTAIFGRFAQIPSDGVPYAVFSLTALVPWTYFSTALTGSSNSLVASTNLITKVYFPRLVIPIVPVLAGLVDFSIALAILLITMLGFGIVPSVWALAALPMLVLVMMATAAGVGAWLASLTIQYRDVKHILPFAIQVWMFASPIIYPMSIVPERWRMLYAVNPMAGVIEAFRSVLLATDTVSWGHISASLAMSVALLATGMAYFRRTERIFADVV